MTTLSIASDRHGGWGKKPALTDKICFYFWPNLKPIDRIANLSFLK